MTRIYHVNGRTFHVEQDMIDATPMDEPDPAWRFVDANGHVHEYEHESAVPTLVQITDMEADDEYPAIWHYECRQCGAVVQPGRRATMCRQFIAGQRSCYIDDVQVSESEFKRRLLAEQNGRTL